MKHTLKITALLLVMFFIAQLIGLYVSHVYSPHVVQQVDSNGNITNETSYSLPYNLEPPQDNDPTTAATSIVIALFIAVALMLLLMKLRAEIFLRLWFFVVIIMGLSICFNAFFHVLPNSGLIAGIIAVPLAILKVFKRDVVAHNLTEMLVYPGIAAVFVPLLNIWAVVILLIIISAYDIYAVWHAGFMQKMAKYQMEKVKVFSGFFVPYLAKKDRVLLEKAKKSKSKKKVKVAVAILGGGDVVFPIIVAGVILHAWGFAAALAVSIGATIALALLFYFSEKGKFYPAMPFITAGCIAGLIIGYLI